MTKRDIHGYEKRLKSALRRIEMSDLPEGNKTLLLEFKDYLFAVYVILRFLSGLADDVTILFALALLPLLGIFVIVWGYGLKLKMPGLELDYYPVEKVMKPPVIVHEDLTGREAEESMLERGTDFLSVVDSDGIFRVFLLVLMRIERGLMEG